MHRDRSTGKKGTDSRAIGEIKLVGLEEYVGAKEQKSSGTIPRCDALRQGTQKEKHVGGEIKMMGSESAKLRCGAWGSPSGDVTEVLHLLVQVGLSLQKVTGVGEVVQEGYGECAGARAPVIPEERGGGEGRGCKGERWKIVR